MRIGSLFSGAGGLDLAALELFPGSSMAWHCEVDTAASKVLAHHWPDVPNLGDVAAVDWSAVEPVDVLTGGFPCQDVSLAGRRAGLTTESRSGLWSHMAAAIAVLRPRYVLIENVKGLLSAQAIRGVERGSDGVGDLGGRLVLRALGAVLGDLAGLGFDAEWTCLPASKVGAAHRRERVFVLAFPADADCAGLEGAQPAARRDVPAGSHPARVALLPTPRATDGAKGGPNQRGSAGDLMLPSAVAQLLPTPRASDGQGGPNPMSWPERQDDVETRVLRITTPLLPTPSAAESTGGGQHPDKREGHSRQLIDFALLDGSARWGDYEPAIRRQEQMSRPAPAPTEPNTKGNPRLSAAFAEWLMFWPAGWVTDPEIGLSRNDQLRVIGNGVVPPQAVAAFAQLLLSEREGIAS